MIMLVGAGCGLSSVVLGKILDNNVLAVDKASVIELLDHNIKSNSVYSHSSSDNIKTRNFDWNFAMESSQERIRDAIKWESDLKLSSPEYVFPSVILLSDCFYQCDAVEPLLRLLDAVTDNGTVVIVANELRTAFDEFLNKLNNKGRAILWNIKVLYHNFDYIIPMIDSYDIWVLGNTA